MENIDTIFNFNQEEFSIVIYLNNGEHVCSLNQFTDFMKSQNNCILVFYFTSAMDKTTLRIIFFFTL